MLRTHSYSTVLYHPDEIVYNPNVNEHEDLPGITDGEDEQDGDSSQERNLDHDYSNSDGSQGCKDSPSEEDDDDDNVENKEDQSPPPLMDPQAVPKDTHTQAIKPTPKKETGKTETFAGLEKGFIINDERKSAGSTPNHISPSATSSELKSSNSDSAADKQNVAVREKAADKENIKTSDIWKKKNQLVRSSGSPSTRDSSLLLTEKDDGPNSVKAVLKEASDFIKNGMSSQALVALLQAEKRLEELKPDSPDCRAAKYLLVKFLIREGDQHRRFNFYDEEKFEDARRRIEELKDEWDEGYNQDMLPLVFFLSAELYLKYNDFPNALQEIEESQTRLAKNRGITKYYLPGFKDLIEETVQATLEKKLEEMSADCHHNIQNPTFKCNGTNCEVLHYRRKVYDTDFKPMKYQGYHQLCCTGNCVLNYHPTCWKEFEKERGKKSKELINEECPTPDCGCRIVKYSFWDESGKEKGVVECLQSEGKEEKPKVKAKKEKARKETFDTVFSMLPPELQRHRQDSEAMSEGSGDTPIEPPSQSETSLPPPKEDSAAVPPPDLPAVPLKKEDPEEEFGGTKKKVGKKQKGREKKKEKQVLLDVNFKNQLWSGASSSTVFIGEDTVVVPQTSSSGYKPTKPLALADHQDIFSSVKSEEDSSKISVSEKLELIVELEEKEEVKECLQLLVSILVDRGTWMSLGDGVIAEVFDGHQGDVQKLIQLYGSKKSFLEQPRDDFNHQFLVDSERNMVNLKDNALRAFCDAGPEERATGSQQDEVDSAGRSPSTESHSSSGISSSSNDNNNGKVQGTNEEAKNEQGYDSEEEESEKDEEISRLQRENRVLKRNLDDVRRKLDKTAEESKTYGITIEELNDKCYRLQRTYKSEKRDLGLINEELNNKLKEVNAERDSLLPEMTKLKQENKTLREKVKQLQDHVEKDRSRAKAKEENLHKELNLVKSDGEKLAERATEAEVKLLTSKKSRYVEQCQELIDTSDEELRIITAATRQLKSSKVKEVDRLKKEWADYCMQWMQFRKQVSQAKESVTERLDGQIDAVRAGAWLGSLETAALCLLPTKPRMPRPDDPQQYVDSCGELEERAFAPIAPDEQRPVGEPTEGVVQLSHPIPVPSSRPILGDAPMAGLQRNVEPLRPIPVVPPPGLRGAAGFSRVGTSGREGSSVNSPADEMSTVELIPMAPENRDNRPAAPSPHPPAPVAGANEAQKKRRIPELHRMVKESLPDVTETEFKMALRSLRGAFSSMGGLERTRGAILDEILRSRASARACVPPPIVPVNPPAPQAPVNTECLVCHEPFRPGDVNEVCPHCSQRFHLACLDQWLHMGSGGSKCPICYKHVKLDKDFPALGK